MSTSAGFTPPAAPPCPYAPRMTRAAAMALATAGGLKENCVVVITDGPTIGVPGFTSPTEIELNPTSPTQLGQTARVHQNYTTEPWAGLYDINLGAGSIIRLTDNRNNTAFDTDANSPTVQTQVPWGQGTLLQFRDNTFEDATMTWVAPFTAGFNFNDNTVADANLDFTGLTTNFVNINGSEFRNAKLAVSATSTGAITLTRIKVTGVLATTAYLTLAETGTGSVTMTDSEIRAGYAVSISHPSAAVSITDSILKGNLGTATLAAATTINDTTIIAGSLNIQTGTTGNNSISRSTVNTSTITKTTGSTGVLNVNNSLFNNATITLGAANGATTNTFNNMTIDNSLFSLLGPVAGGGRNDFTSGMKFSGATVNVAANATGGINMQNGWVEQATVNQNQTVGIGALQLFDCSLRGFSTVTCNNTADPGLNGTGLNRITMVDSSITVSGVSGKTGSSAVAQQTDMLGSTLVIPASVGTAVFLDKLRMHGCSLNTAGFAAQDSIIDGNFTKTMTATNNNKLANQSFDNWV